MRWTPIKCLYREKRHFAIIEHFIQSQQISRDFHFKKAAFVKVKIAVRKSRGAACPSC
jgi:hypothetical protein